MNYLFFLGNHPKLSKAEIQSLLNYFDISFQSLDLSSDILQINSSSKIPDNLIDRLGGTIKISEIVRSTDHYDAQVLADIIAEKKDFGLSFYNIKIKNFKVLNLSKQIKKIIKLKGQKINFIIGSKKNTVSSAQITNKLGKNGVELIIYRDKEKYILAKTIGWQDINRWSYLDYGIPKSDAKKGMLPPKLAQMMINLCLDKNNQKPIIYDPFCGCGRVLLQATLNGMKCYASDIDPSSVDDTKNNYDWLKEKFEIDKKLDMDLNNIFIFDATQPGFEKHLGEKISAIVTEPFLGKPMKISPSDNYVKKMFERLSETYTSFFENIKPVLNNNAKLVVIFPCVNDRSLFSQVVDKIKNLGYYKISNFAYARKYQIVKREIVVFGLDNKVNNG